MVIDVRCPACNKLLFKAEGFGARIEIKWYSCKSVVVWPVLAAEVKHVEVKPLQKRA